MKKISAAILLLTLIFSVSCGQQGPKVTFVEDSNNKKIDVMVDGKLLTTYQWPDNICKPVLYPLYTSSGTEITRGYPIKPRVGERMDHNHQIGNWLTYGNVEGYDFWGNGSRGLGTRNDNGGVIKHLSVEKIKEGSGKGYFITTGSWVDPSGTELLKEKTEYHFIADGTNRIIDRIATWTAAGREISMPDTKEGMFGIRVAKQLELPAGGTATVYGSDGQPQRVDASEDKTVSGDYLSSEGVTGVDVWSTRARWMDLFGNIGGEKISVVICDHPKNPCYPTYWHARGYGLFAANPLGWVDFTNKKEELNFKIPAGESVTFRYRIVISSGNHLSKEEINGYADDFAGKY